MSLETGNSFLKLKIFENAESFFEWQCPPDQETIIGRNAQCDLVLKSMRTSKRHCRIYFQHPYWHIEDLGSQNGTGLNGSKIKTEIVKDGDTVQIGDYRIEVEWKPVQTAAPAAEEEDDDRTVVIGRAAAKSHEDRTIVRPSSLPVDAVGNSQLNKIISFLKERKLVVVLGGILIFFLAILIIIPGSEQDEVNIQDHQPASAESDPSKAVHDMETQNRINNYLQSGREHFETGNYSQALVRIQAVLEIDPQNQSARSYLEQIRQKMAEAEKRRRQALEEERKKKERVKVITSRTREAIAADDLQKAQEIIAEAVFLAPKNPEVVKLQSDIEKAIQDERLTRQEEAQQRAEKMAKLKQHFDRGQQHYDRGNYHEALKEWQAVLALNIETTETEHIRHAIVHLRKLLEKDLEKDYEKALKLRASNDLTGAISVLQKVVRVSPEYRDTQQIMNELLSKVEQKARRLYQEGLVYEGLGQHQRAVEKWRQVLKEMPLTENEYHQKALEKLQ